MGQEPPRLNTPSLLPLALTTGGLAILGALAMALTCQGATAAAERNPTALEGDYRETAVVENNILASWYISAVNLTTARGFDSIRNKRHFLKSPPGVLYCLEASFPQGDGHSDPLSTTHDPLVETLCHAVMSKGHIRKTGECSFILWM